MNARSVTRVPSDRITGATGGSYMEFLRAVARNSGNLVALAIAAAVVFAVAGTFLVAACGGVAPLPPGESCMQCARAWIGSLSGWVAAGIAGYIGLIHFKPLYTQAEIAKRAETGANLQKLDQIIHNFNLYYAEVNRIFTLLQPQNYRNHSDELCISLIKRCDTIVQKMDEFKRYTRQQRPPVIAKEVYLKRQKNISLTDFRLRPHILKIKKRYQAGLDTEAQTREAYFAMDALISTSKGQATDTLRAYDDHLNAVEEALSELVDARDSIL